MPEHTAFMWMMSRAEPDKLGIRSSEYLLIDRLAVCIEMDSDMECSAVAALHVTPDAAREMVLDTWMGSDERMGLTLDGTVTAARVEVDLVELSREQQTWGPVSPNLAALANQIKCTGVPL